jgi:hypothetical protein
VSVLRSYLDDRGRARDGQQWAPEVFHRMSCIDVAHIAESVRHACDGNGNREECSSNGPAKTLGPVKEFLPWCDVPADLEMHRKNADENCTQVSQTVRSVAVV